MARFPNMTVANHSVESPISTMYNCIAWAFDKSNVRKMWPKTRYYFWPPGVRNEETIDAFVDLFRSVGYEVCLDGSVEQGYEKVAIYAKGTKPTHAARQCSSGKWTSKIGWLYEDIKHDDPAVLEIYYGSVVKYMRRPRKVKP